ncbi:MAG: YceI family protein [Alphaproteobacteria bacterium]
MAKGLGILGTIFVVAGLVWYFFYSQAVPGFWVLNSGESFFHFSSTKNGDIIEEHAITNLVGEVEFTGKVIVRLDLNSLDTGIDIRDERMKEFLFEVDKYPVARIEADYNLSVFGEIEPGSVEVVPMNFTVFLHGVEKEYQLALQFDRQAWDRVVITPAEDFIVEAADFQLEEGLLKLRDLAGLDDISTKVPMNFTFVFEGTASFALTEEIEPRK